VVDRDRETKIAFVKALIENALDEWDRRVFGPPGPPPLMTHPSHHLEHYGQDGMACVRCGLRVGEEESDLPCRYPSRPIDKCNHCGHFTRVDISGGL